MRGEMVARWLDEKKEIVIVAPFLSFALWENALVRIALVLCDAELCVTYGVRKQSTLSRGCGLKIPESAQKGVAGRSPCEKCVLATAP